MTVRELIEELHKLDQDARVFVSGYEGGYCDIEDIGELAEYALSVNSKYYYGPHELVTERQPFPGVEKVKAYVL